MATLALVAAGSSIGGAVGGAGAVAFGLTGAQIGGIVGGLAGSYIDQQFLFKPKQNEIPNPRLDDYQIQTNSEGSPINYVLGPENKTTGTLIWIGKHNGKTLEVRSSKTKVGGKGGGGSSQTSYAYYADIAIAVCEGEINAIRTIWADSKVIYYTGQTDSRYEDITLYTGGTNSPNDPSMTANTGPNSHIESFEGSGNVPKYNGLCYVVIDSLSLGDWGNRIPNFSFLVEKEPSQSVASAIAELCERGGLTSEQYDVSRVPYCLTGYQFSGPVSMVRALEPILAAYDIMVQEKNGKLYFYERGDEEFIVVDELHLATAEFNQNRNRPFQNSTVADFDIPTHMLVRYVDSNASYERGEQSAQRVNFISPNVEVIDVPLVLSADQAATLAKKRLYRSWTERHTVSISLPWIYNNAIEGDILLVTHEGESYRLLILERSEGDNKLLNFECVLQSVNSISVVESGYDSPHYQTGDNVPYVAPDMTVIAKSIPSLIDDHTDKRVIVVGSASSDQSINYRGSTLYNSHVDSTSLFDPISPVPFQSTMGTVLGTLGGGISPDLWDNVNIVTVTLLNGELESVSEQEVASGKNMVLIGNEIVGFVNATLVSGTTYTLSKLLRGVRNTQNYIDSHSPNEDFLLLDSSLTLPVYYSASEENIQMFLRSVAADGDISDETSVSVTPNGESYKAWQPSQITTSRNGSDDITIEWVRRTRAVWDVGSSVEAPLLEGQEKYKIDVLSGSGGSVVRTITVTDDTTATYTASQQTSDGLTPGNTVYFIIYMIDSVFGRGFPTEEQSAT